MQTRASRFADHCARMLIYVLEQHLHQCQIKMSSEASSARSLRRTHLCGTVPWSAERQLGSRVKVSRPFGVKIVSVQVFFCQPESYSFRVSATGRNDFRTISNYNRPKLGVVVANLSSYDPSSLRWVWGYDFFDKSCIEVHADDIDRFLTALKLISWNSFLDVFWDSRIFWDFLGYCS